MVVQRRFIVFFALLAVAMLAACKSTGTAYNPPGGTAFRATHLAVSDVVNNAILVFPATANGASVTPSRTLSGGSTTLNQPEGFFVDTTHGKIYVGNYSGGSAGTITEYSMPPGGNVSPISTLGGGSTTLKGPGGIYVSASGKIYVADYRNAAVDVYAAGTTTQAPVQQITSTALTNPSGLWLDAHGNIWVGNAAAIGGTAAVLEFAPNASASATPLATITGSNTQIIIPMGVFIDAHGNIWVANAAPGPGNVEEFSAGATGNATPTRVIGGAASGISDPNGIVVDGAGYIYVGDYGAASVFVFAPSANGNVAPVQTIPANATTGLNKPIGVIAY